MSCVCHSYTSRCVVTLLVILVIFSLQVRHTVGVCISGLLRRWSMLIAAHSSGFMEEHGYLYAVELALKLVAQTLQCL